MSSAAENLEVVDVEDDDELMGIDKKRKMQKRSEVWNHFTTIVDPDNPEKEVQLCIHCKKRKYTYISKNGTSSMRTHQLSCEMNPANAHLNKNSIESYCTGKEVGADGVNKYEMGGLLKFDQEGQRLLLAKMLIVDGLPFKFVQNPGFVEFCKFGMPWFIIPSRQTIARDCMTIFKKEKEDLKAFFVKTKQRISITTDGWTSNQNLSYLVVTAHFIDDSWTLRKRIINFITCPTHKGEDVGLLIEQCLKEWGIESLFTVTVDNASANDKTVAYLRKKFVAKGNAILQGKYMHVRCVAHILNLIVKSGLKDHIISIDRIRNLVKYILNSPARELKLRECAFKENILSKAFLTKDVATRWNSIYLMLERALIFKNAFDRYKVEDPAVRFDFPDDDNSDRAYPTDEDWDVASFMSKILENFYSATLRVSGVSYVTANIFLDEIGSIYAFLNQWEKSDDESLKNLAINMKEKFEKYWSDDCEKSKSKVNVVFYVASLLDPRYKLSMLKGMLEAMFGLELGSEISNTAIEVLKEFYEEYQSLNPSVRKFPSSSGTSSSGTSSIMASRTSTKFMKPRSSLFNQVREKSGGFEEQSEIDKYLNANLVGPDEFGENYQILDWWKDHRKDYPILSLIARHIFAIPISTVASESAFSTSGRIIDDFRASLLPKTAEALILAQDWLRENCKGRILTDEEELEILEEIQEELRSVEEDNHSMT